MPQLPESLDPKGLKKDREVEVEWRTVSYRSVATVVALVFLAVGTVLYFRYQDPINRTLLRLLDMDAAVITSSATVQKQARFLNIEGTVSVKKANAFAWVTATPNLALDKGDVVRTSSEGNARIAFADGALYTMRPDTLVVVEENSSSPSSRSTKVSVNVTSGEVDLATTKFAGESKVTFANAVARVGQDSRANVKNDPKSQLSQITVRQGQSEVLRGTERMVLGAYEQASFRGNAGRMSRTRVMGPPIPTMPSDKAPVVAGEGAKAEVTFAWTPVNDAKSYRLRISTSPFSTPVYDKRVSSVSVAVKNLPEGTYYWAVASIDAQGKESQPSDPSKFDLLRNVPKDEILLEVQPLAKRGNQMEIVGRTEPGARVMVNDQEVFSVQPDGAFKHFTQPLAPGSHQITIIALNAKGQIATRRRTVYID